MAKAPSPIVLLLGQDSLRADRALSGVLKARGVDASEIVRIWGDESSFSDVFAAAVSRSLFSDKTVVLVRRAERLRGALKDSDNGGSDHEDADEPEEPAPRAKGKKPAVKMSTSANDLPDLDPSTSLILLARKADRRVGMWKKISKVAELIDVDYQKGRSLAMAAGAEARALGLKIPEDLLRDIVEQSGPSLGRIVSELEKISLYETPLGRGTEEILAVTSSPPLYRLSDAIALKNKREALSLLDEALRQGEAGLRVLATAYGTVRKLAFFKALRQAGVASAEAGAQASI
ncbi:MAG: hypothetical protein JJE39_02750, partial [Vicinamibacteria bacterium]|nr:hypothetical protein [Vicinamibacteria bacterium]